jgi:hypothetical protein
LLIDGESREFGIRLSFGTRDMQVTIVSQERQLAINGQVYAHLPLHPDGTATIMVDLHEHAPLLRSDQPTMLLHRPVYRGSLRKLGRLRISVIAVDNLGRVRASPEYVLQ